MLDTIQYPLWEDAERRTLTSGLEQPSSPLKICTCKNCEEMIYQHAVKPKFEGYTKINPRVVESMTDHKYFLCDQMVEAFVFKIRSWGKFRHT